MSRFSPPPLEAYICDVHMHFDFPLPLCPETPNITVHYKKYNEGLHPSAAHILLTASPPILARWWNMCGEEAGTL